MCKVNSFQHTMKKKGITENRENDVVFMPYIVVGFCNIYLHCVGMA